jgi:hypothetical protein
MIRIYVDLLEPSQSMQVLGDFRGKYRFAAGQEIGRTLLVFVKSLFVGEICEAGLMDLGETETGDANGVHRLGRIALKIVLGPVEQFVTLEDDLPHGGNLVLLVLLRGCQLLHLRYLAAQAGGLKIGSKKKPGVDCALKGHGDFLS